MVYNLRVQKGPSLIVHVWMWDLLKLGGNHDQKNQLSKPAFLIHRSIFYIKTNPNLNGVEYDTIVSTDLE